MLDRFNALKIYLTSSERRLKVGAFPATTDTKLPNSVHIDTHLVQRLVAAQFPEWANIPIKPVEPGGWDNRTFHLGAEMSVRLPSAERYTAQARKEHRWLAVIAPQLPLPIPIPLALGEPAEGYPWHWSIYGWLKGENASIERIDDLDQFAADLAQFLKALQRIDPTDAPTPGKSNFFRGGALATYDTQTRDAIDALRRDIDSQAAAEIWTSALDAAWLAPPVWLHGDVAAGNLLVHDGRLSAVIDFRQLAVGDAACDMAIAWTLLTGSSREVFRTDLAVDDATWARGRGWALWKALIVLAKQLKNIADATGSARRIIDELIDDWKS